MKTTSLWKGIALTLATALCLNCGEPEPEAVVQVLVPPTPAQDVRATVVAEITATAMALPTTTPTPTSTHTPTVTPTQTPTATPTPDVRATVVAEITATAVARPTDTPTPEPTPMATVTNTPRPTPTPIPIPISTPTPIPTPTPTATETPPPAPTPAPIPTNTPTPVPTPTPTATETPSPVPTPTPLPANTPSPIPTSTPPATETPSPVPTPTPTSTQTATPVPTPTPTSTQTATPVPTPTPTSTQTATPVPTPTPTFADVVSNIEPAVVQILTSAGAGSGFIVSEDGLVVTNAHVVGGSRRVTVRLSIGKEYMGDVVSLDKATDLAIIDLSTNGSFPTIPLGDSDQASVGDNVVAVGYPIGSVLGQSPTITRGIVSSRRVFDGVDYLQTDAAINPGNSGGPLINRSGEVVGVNTARYVEVGGRPIEGIGLAIAIKEVTAKLPVLPLEISQDAPFPSLTPTPVVPNIDDTGEVYQNGKYGYSIRVAPGWTWEDVAEMGNPVSFWAPGNVGLLKVTVHDVAEFSSLRKFAEWRRDEIDGSTIDRKQEGGREFYWLVSPTLRPGRGCSVFYIELVTFSSSYPGKPYGFVLSSAVCEHSIDPYDQDRLDMLGSFSEWEHYRNDTYDYSMNVAPEWTLRQEETDHVSLWAPNGRSLLEVSVHDLGNFASFPAFAEWRRNSVREDGKSSAEFGVITSEKREEEGREFYWLEYRKQESEEVCVSRHTDLIGRFSQNPRAPYGFIVHFAFCKYSHDIYGRDVSGMLASFMY